MIFVETISNNKIKIIDSKVSLRDPNKFSSSTYIHLGVGEEEDLPITGLEFH